MYSVYWDAVRKEIEQKNYEPEDIKTMIYNSL